MNRKEWDRKYYQKNRDKIIRKRRDYAKNYRKTPKGKEVFRCGQEVWREKNKEKENIKCLTTHYRKEILEAKGNKCKKCGSEEKLEIHHKKYNIKATHNRKKTTKKLIKTTDILCRNCHRKHHRKYPT